jgi:hypothetical protein
MLLSTSNSKQAVTGRHIVAVILACAMVYLAAELATSCFFWRFSSMQHRRELERRAALQMKAPRGAAPRVLIVGNSLLLDAVDFQQLKKEVGDEIKVQRFVLENTFYLDWYYGLHQLFGAGVHPNVVVVSLSASQLVSDNISGERTARMLVDGSDLLRFSSDVGADRNKTISLVVSHLSEFYGWRADIRTWLMGKILPDLPNLTSHLRFPSDPPSNEKLYSVAKRRLLELRNLCALNHVDCVLLMPPSPGSNPGARIVLQAAAADGVTVLLPMPSLPDNFFSDGFHLNAEGAARFTPLLATSLKQVIRNPGAVSAQTMPSTSPTQTNARYEPVAVKSGNAVVTGDSQNTAGSRRAGTSAAVTLP